jgi:hypothetical protein
MTDDRTAFPDLLSVVAADPERINYDRLCKLDPATAEAVFPPPDVPDPEVVSPAPTENPRRGPESYPEAATYKEHSFRWRSRDLNALSPDFSVVEIARWHCPNGHLGIISSIATHLGINLPIEDSDPPAVLEIALDLPWQPWIVQLLGLPLRWWLRLEAQRERVELAPVVLRSPAELPGYPFPELPTWNDQRFGWAYHGLQPLRLLVPEGHTARLFCGLEFKPEGGDGGGGDPEILSGKLPRRSSFWRDPKSPGAQAAIQVVAPGFPPSVESAPIAADGLEPAAAIMAEIDDSGIAIAGRMIGTIQTYRESRLATEAARRGL